MCSNSWNAPTRPDRRRTEERNTRANTKKKGVAKARGNARYVLHKLIGALTFGSMLATIRDTDSYTLDGFARKLGVSRSHLCDVEKGPAWRQP